MSIATSSKRYSIFLRRACKSMVQGCIIVALGLVLSEIGARVVFGLEPLRYSRMLNPILVSGDDFDRQGRAGQADEPGGPVPLGYASQGLIFAAGPQAAPRSTTTLTDFLFEHGLARYSADDVDRLMCEDDSATGLYVLGGSGAQGYSATAQYKTWHALLEAGLRRELGRENVYVFNAAMGGYISYQERMAYHLAVAPRRASAVLIYDSYNDLMFNPRELIRPGDPTYLGTWYGRIYGSTGLFLLAENSALVNQLLQALILRQSAAARQQLSDNDELFRRQASATVDLYLENMSEVLDACQSQGRPCWVALQPNRALTAIHTGKSRPDLLPDRRVREIFEMLHERLAHHRFRDRFIDLTGVLDGGAGSGYFTDTVHIDDRAQSLIAAALLPIVAPVLANAAPAREPGPAERCAARARLQLVERPALARLVAQEGSVDVQPDRAVVRSSSRQWSWAARLMLDPHPKPTAQDLVVRVKLAVKQGEMTVFLFDEATKKAASVERPVLPSDHEVVVYLKLWGPARPVSLIFAKQSPEKLESEAVVSDVTVLAR